MIDHVSVQCADLVRSAAFYDAVLGALGGRRMMTVDGRIGFGTDFPSFWLGRRETGQGFRETHLAFRAADRAAVRAFHEAAVALGAPVLYPPREWPDYHAAYFGVFVRDPDGNNVEAVCHTPE